MSEAAKPPTKCSLYRLLYLLVWMVVGVSILFISFRFINEAVPSITSETQHFVEVGGISVVFTLNEYLNRLLFLFMWSTCMFLLYVWFGDCSETHQTHYRPYWGIWTVFALIFMVMILSHYMESSIFLSLRLLYALLVLFPWILLLLFLFHRRTYRATQIRDDLIRLDSTGDLLAKAVGEQDCQYDLGWLMEYLKSHSYQDLLKHPPSKKIKDGLQEITVLLAAKAFGNFEYALNLLCLSLLTAIGWYYVFYQPTSLSLVSWKAIAAINTFDSHIIKNLNPMTLGFVGAYFFSLQFLVRRYLANDLYPSAFLQVTQRLLLVLILSLVLSFISLYLPSIIGFSLTLAAFLVGIFPKWGLHLISNLSIYYLINDIPPLKGKVDIPENLDVPLTKLDGINIWTEERLLQRGIDNVQSLATASIERLVIGTPFPTIQIVDWIDQAILYNHTGHRGELFGRLRGVGVRTASDLLDTASLGYVTLNSLSKKAFEPDKKRLNIIAKALTIKLSDDDKSAKDDAFDHISEEQLTSLLILICKAMWPDPNIRYILNFYEQMRKELTKDNDNSRNTSKEPGGGKDKVLGQADKNNGLVKNHKPLELLPKLLLVLIFSVVASVVALHSGSFSRR